MKKTIFLCSFFLVSLFFNSFAKGPGDPITEAGNITTLILDADVNVVLVDNETAVLEVTATRHLMEMVTLKKKGDTLVVGALKSRNFKDAGTIYVPAGKLRNIRVNSAAEIRSLSVLRAPRLDVVINGECAIAISSIGVLNLVETEKYIFDRTTETRPFPSSLLQKRGYEILNTSR